MNCVQQCHIDTFIAEPHACALPQPTLFLTPCPECVLFVCFVGLFFTQDCDCRQVPLLYSLTTLASVSGRVLSPDWTQMPGKTRGCRLERMSGPPDTQAEHSPLVPRLPDTWKPRSRPAVTYSICDPGLSRPRLFSQFSFRLSLTSKHAGFLLCTASVPLLWGGSRGVLVFCSATWPSQSYLAAAWLSHRWKKSSPSPREQGREQPWAVSTGQSPLSYHARSGPPLPPAPWPSGHWSSLACCHHLCPGLRRASQPWGHSVHIITQKPPHLVNQLFFRTPW